ncbi:hypothetical protein O6H91_12G003100 [Diphasiastrum complanatum]|uniref:Uncharacterized protein n=1 Tax=Diphasiastrum complanatum TaxID=34168 RepID=A0ACC2BYE1_DIPCM|nr:hypothetical protein O6H91_12G003100 [Diphasiastrum complanatum]
MMKPMEALVLGKALIHNRWMVVVASIFLMTAAGGLYTFGIYSQSIKLSLGYDQETINTLSLFREIGSNVGVIGGILYDLTGPPLVLASAAVINFAGYVMIWLAVTGRIERPEVWQMCLYFVIASSWTSFINSACTVTCIKNFPHRRGIVMGLLKGSLGLGGAMLTLLYSAVYGDNPQAFILLLAWFPTMICLLLMLFIRIVKAKQLESEMKNFHALLGIILSLATYLMLVVITQDISKVSKSIHGLLCGIMFAMLLLPLWVVMRNEIHDKTAGAAFVQDPQANSGPEIIQQIATIKDLEDAASNSNQFLLPTEKEENKVTNNSSKSILQRGILQNARKLSKFIIEAQKATDLTVPQALVNLNLWIIFIVSTCGIGSQRMVIDNLGQIGAALGYSSKNITTCVSLVSIWNCLGRLGSGFISESFLRSKVVPRTVFLVTVLVISCLGHLILAFNLPAALYMGSIIIGLCYGAQYTLVCTIVSEISGLRFYATISNCVQVSISLGLYVLSVRTAGVIYDQEARKQHSMLPLGHLVQGLVPPPVASTSHAATLLCHGSQCYKTTFFIVTGTSFAAAMFACVLVLRTRLLYKQLHSSLHTIHQIEPKLEPEN